MTDTVSIPTAFFLAAILNYLLCIALLFRHKARWNPLSEVLFYLGIVILVAIPDFYVTQSLLHLHATPFWAKSLACALGLDLNFLGRRYVVFPEPTVGSMEEVIRVTVLFYADTKGRHVSVHPILRIQSFLECSDA